MSNTSPDDWSPADNPYAIAVSEAQWWLHTADLTILRMRDGDDRWTHPFSSEQIDARTLVHALRQVLTAEALEQAALTDLRMDQAVGDVLAQARRRFEDALPGIKHMRDALMHFDEWSRGEGRGPQKQRVRTGEALRDVARDYSGFGYNPGDGTVSLGPYTINVETAGEAAYDLCQAIYAAAHEVDKKNTADLRAKTVQALANAGIQVNEPGSALQVSSRHDVRVWLSLRNKAADGKHEELAVRAVAALAKAGLSLVSNAQPQNDDGAERLAKGEGLFVNPMSQWHEQTSPSGARSSRSAT